MAIAQATGNMVFNRPNAFDIDDPGGFSQAEVVRRMLEDRELSIWSRYHGDRIPMDRAGATPTELVGLPVPP